jgi:hypothetical protein
VIIDTLLADHAAGRDLMAAIGNTALQATAERQGYLVQFTELWRAHLRRIAQATAGLGDDGAAAGLGQRVADGAEALAAEDAGGHEVPDFQRRFVELKAAFDTQCEIEETGLVPRLRALPSDRLAALSAA